MDKQILKWVKRVKKSGDKLAADKLISAYLDEIFGYVFKRVDSRSAAKDVTQEIFISMLKSIKNYDDKLSSFRTWLYSIASRRIADYYREKEKHQAIDIAEIQHRLEDITSRNAEILQELSEIREFIDELATERDRNVFKLKVFDGYTFAEIATEMQMPESTVKTNFYATQKMIRKKFKGVGDGNGKIN